MLIVSASSVVAQSDDDPETHKALTGIGVKDAIVDVAALYSRWAFRERLWQLCDELDSVDQQLLLPFLARRRDLIKHSKTM